MGLTGWRSARCCRAKPARSRSWALPDGKPHFQPKAKRVIWLFMLGGVSHVESFDPKPALNKYAGKQLPKHRTKTYCTTRSQKRTSRRSFPGSTTSS